MRSVAISTLLIFVCDAHLHRSFESVYNDKHQAVVVWWLLDGGSNPYWLGYEKEHYYISLECKEVLTNRFHGVYADDKKGDVLDQKRVRLSHRVCVCLNNGGKQQSFCKTASPPKEDRDVTIAVSDIIAEGVEVSNPPESWVFPQKEEDLDFDNHTRETFTSLPREDEDEDEGEDEGAATTVRASAASRTSKALRFEELEILRGDGPFLPRLHRVEDVSFAGSAMEKLESIINGGKFHPTGIKSIDKYIRGSEQAETKKSSKKKGENVRTAKPFNLIGRSAAKGEGFLFASDPSHNPSRRLIVGLLAVLCLLALLSLHKFRKSQKCTRGFKETMMHT